MAVFVVEPWNEARWDAYVASHPHATVYHTSAWIRIVAEVGRYPSLCLVHEREGAITGVLPMLAVESAFTGRRVTSLPFSDTAAPLADDAESVHALLNAARAQREGRGAAYHELRGMPVLRDGFQLEPARYARYPHFKNYLIPLAGDPEAVRMTFSRTGVRQTITKGARLGVTVRDAGVSGLDTFYALYVRNRRRHGIPPQPRKLFALVLERMQGAAGSALYLAEHEGRATAGLITVRFNGTTYAKYEGVDETRRELAALYPLFWKTIEDAVLAGDRWYDFGRTDADNQGLVEFKKRWGTREVEIPYFFDPPGDGVSVAKASSMKYRVFTSAFRRMPEAWTVRVGARIFRHFG